MDCVSGSKQFIKDNDIDLIICDPPFGIGESSFNKHYNRDETTVLSGYMEAPEDYSKFSLDWISEAKRILKDSGSMYIISGWTHLDDILFAIKENDLYLENHIIWKFNFGVNTSKKYVSSHYHILYLKKSKDAECIFNKNCRFGDDEKDDDKKSLLYKDMEDVWVINKEFQHGEIKNKNKLPEELLRKIILYSSNENDKVCDFFLGNFTTAVVAKKLGRSPYGFEINKRAYNYHIGELDKVISGCELKNLRVPPKSKATNRGKSLSKKEVKEIVKEFKSLSKEDLTKRQKIENIGKKHGRGYFSILNVLDANIK